MSEKADQGNAEVCPRRASAVAPIGRNTRRRTAVAVPSRYKNRPAQLRSCLYRAWEAAEALGLSCGTLAVLQAIIATGVSISAPFNPIFAKKATLARYADVGEATVYRALLDLERQDLITRTKQARLEDGSLNLSEIIITQKLAAVLGLTVHNNTSDEPEACEDSFDSQQEFPPPIKRDAPPIAVPSTIVSEPKTSHNCRCPRLPMIDGVIDGSVYKERFSEQEASVNNQSTRCEFVRIEGRSVAKELLWLIAEKRLTFGALFQLQTLAKQIPGQQLSDFVAYRSERIKQLATTADCYRYIKKLISDGLDAKYLCAQRAKQQHRALRKHQRDSAAAKRAAWCRARHDITMINPQTKTTFKINANHGSIEVGENGYPSTKPNIKITSRFIRAVEEGRLIPFAAHTPARDLELGSRRLDEIAAKFPWLKRKSDARPKE